MFAAVRLAVTSEGSIQAPCSRVRTLKVAPAVTRGSASAMNASEVGMLAASRDLVRGPADNEANRTDPKLGGSAPPTAGL